MSTPLETKVRFTAEAAQAIGEMRKLSSAQKQLKTDSVDASKAMTEAAAAVAKAVSDGLATAQAAAKADQVASKASMEAARAKAQAARDAATLARQAAKDQQDAQKSAAKAVEAVEKAAAAERARVAQQAAAVTKQQAKEAADAQIAATKAITQAQKTAAAEKNQQIDSQRAAVDKLGTTFSRVRDLALAFFGIQMGVAAVRNVISLVDGYNGMVGRLKISTDSQGQYNQALQTTVKLSDDYQQSLIATGRLVDKLYSSIKPLGGTLENAASTTEALLAAMKIDGVTAEESASAILQFSQAMGKGALNGDEFNSVAEATPTLLRALASGLGVSTAALKDMGSQGKLTSSQIVEALSKALPDLQAKSQALGPTLGSAFTDLTNKTQQYLATSNEVRGVLQLLVSGVKALADNIGPLINLVAALAAGFAALKAGAAVSSLATAAAEGGGLVVVLRSMLGLIGGPVGLVVALGALAAGWLAVSSASKKAAEGNIDALREQKRLIEERVGRLKDRVATSGRTRLDAGAQLDDAEKQLRQVNGLISIAESKVPKAAPGNKAASVNMLDPGTIKSFEEENKTRAKIEKDYADKRAAYTLAKDKEIAAARARGDEATAATLEASKLESLKRAKKREDDELRGLSKDSQTDRVAQLKQLYDQELELTLDQIERQKKANEDGFSDGLTDLRTYMAERAKLEGAASSQEIARLESELAQRRKVLATNQSRLAKAPDASSRETLQEAVTQQSQEIIRAETEILEKKRAQVDAERERGRVMTDNLRQLSQQLIELDGQLKEAQGKPLTEADIRTRVQAAYAPLMKEMANAPGGVEKVGSLIDLKVTEQQLAELQRQYQETFDQISLIESQAALDQQAGLITTAEAERSVLAARRDQLPVLDDILAKMQALANTPAQRNQVEQTRQQIGALRDLRTQFELQARSAAQSGLADFLTDVMTRSKSAGEALRDMVGSFAKALLNLINQRLAEKLIDSFAGSSSAGSSGSSSGGWVQALGTIFSSMFHTGGVVGQSGGMGRSVSPEVFRTAPRYHSGGVAGLRPNERAAVLLEGEEVLTEDDPRHVKNGGRSLGGLTVFNNVEISGADGNQSQQSAAANDLLATMNNAIDQWAIKQSRPGGLLGG